LTGRRLTTLLSELFDAPARLQAMSAASRRLGKPDAAGTIVEACEALLKMGQGEHAERAA